MYKKKAKALRFKSLQVARRYSQQQGIYVELDLHPASDHMRLISQLFNFVYQQKLSITGHVLAEPMYFFIYQRQYSHFLPPTESQKQVLLGWLAQQPEVAYVRADQLGETMAEYERATGYRRKW